MGHACAAIATQNNSTVQYSHKIENKRFKLALRCGTGAGGLVAPLPCTAYFGEITMYVAWLFHSKRMPSQFVLVLQPSQT